MTTDPAQPSNPPESEILKETSPTSAPTKWPHWDKLAPLAAFITAIVAIIALLTSTALSISTIRRQSREARESRQQDYEKWQSQLAAQILLAETNRQRDFSIWKQQLAENHTNWITERKIEWDKQEDLWLKQRQTEWAQQEKTWTKEREVEWAQQFASWQKQQDVEKLSRRKSKKEDLYLEFLYHCTKLDTLVQQVAWSEWHTRCMSEIEMSLSRWTRTSEVQLARDTFRAWDDRLTKAQTELNDLLFTIIKLMQSAKLTFSEHLQTPISQAMVELASLKVRIPETPELGDRLRKILKTKQEPSITVLALNELYKAQLPKDSTPRLRSLDEMMFREITFERYGIEVTPDNLTNTAPIILKNGATIQFKNDNPHHLK